MLLLLSNGMDAMLSGCLAKGRWAVLGMVTKGGDWVVRMSHFYGSHKGSWKITATLCRLCALYCGLTVLKLIWTKTSVIMKKARKFRFWQYGTFNTRRWLGSRARSHLCQSLWRKVSVPSFREWGLPTYTETFLDYANRFMDKNAHVHILYVI